MIKKLIKLIKTFLSKFNLISNLTAENLALRQQLIVLNRSIKRPKFKAKDRLFWIMLFRFWGDLPPFFVPPLKLEFRSTTSGAGGRYPSELCGRNVLYSLRYRSINTFASNNVSNISQFKSSSRNLP
jgi:hypothetical protein